MPKFDIVELCFFLLAFIVIVEVLIVVEIVNVCIYRIVWLGIPLGECQNLGLDKILSDTMLIVVAYGMGKLSK